MAAAPIPAPAVFLPAAAGMMPVPADIPAGAIVGVAEVAAAVLYEADVGRRGTQRRIEFPEMAMADAGAVADATRHAFLVRQACYGGPGGPVLPQDILQVRPWRGVHAGLV